MDLLKKLRMLLLNFNFAMTYVIHKILTLLKNHSKMSLLDFDFVMIYIIHQILALLESHLN